MAKNATQIESTKKGIHCDSESWSKLADEIDENPKKYRPMTVADHLNANRELLSRMLSKGLAVGEIAILLREKGILEVSDQTLRKFVKENSLVPAKAPKAAETPVADVSKAAPASAPKALVAKPA